MAIFFKKKPFESNLLRRSSLEWVEESFTFESNYGRQPATPHSTKHIGGSFHLKSFRLLFFFICAVFIIIVSRIFFVQIVRGESYRLIAEGNRQRVVPIPAERGLIFDRIGRQLTKNVPNFSLAIIPQNLPRETEVRHSLVNKLADLTNKTPQEIWQLIEEYGNYSYESIIIQENLDYETALSIEIAAADLPGISVERGSKRQYLAPTISGLSTPTTTQSLSHVIGYEGKLTKQELDKLYSEGYLPSDTLGKSGIENTYESYLRGTYGKKRIEVNAYGREQRELALTPPVPGYHLTLSIDAAIEQKLEEALRHSLEANHQTKGSAIAIDPKNGEVLALVSLPTYDNNDFSGGITKTKYDQYATNPSHPLFNRAISGTYPSGSTIKPVMAAAALQEGIITPKTSFLSTGGLRVGVWFFPDWLSGGHGATNVFKALANSVNTFFYYIGGGYRQFNGLGIERIVHYLNLFGFGSELGIDLPSEASGFVPTEAWKSKTKKEQWYIGDTYNLSIGQGDLLVTPLQIATMTGAVANGGTIYRPHVIKTITDPVKNTKTQVNPTILRNNLIDENYLAIVRQGMRDCVTGGSCRRLNSLPVEVAGKTGTAQWNQNFPNHAWFTSFAPYNNPQIVVTIMIEEGGEGSSAAVPVAQEFYSWWWTYSHSPESKQAKL